MICKKHALIICVIIIIAIFTSNLLSLERSLSDEHCLSKIVSEQLFRITQRIEQITKEASSPYTTQQIQYLEDQKQAIINTWCAGELQLVLKQLPEDLKLKAQTAKPDFATPVLDTRNW